MRKRECAIRRARSNERKRLKRAAKRKARHLSARSAAAAHHDLSYIRNPQTGLVKAHVRVNSPSVLNLAEAYDDTVKFVMGLRSFASQKSRSMIYVDMRSIEKITPAGALMLVAELDRWRRVHGKKLKARDLDEWKPEVRTLLTQMGFLDLLQTGKSKRCDQQLTDVRYLPFHTGINADGKPFLEFLDSLQELTGELVEAPQLFAAVSEAQVNVRQHAYARHKVSACHRRWWLSGSYNVAEKEITVMVLDHGLGIPRTLRLGNLRERFSHFIATTTREALRDDALMISTAIRLGRSATGETFRGHGFTRDIMFFVDSHTKKARLRVLSNKGMLIYEKQAGNETGTASFSNRSASIRGTFLEWKFQI